MYGFPGRFYTFSHSPCCSWFRTVIDYLWLTKISKICWDDRHFRWWIALSSRGLGAHSRLRTSKCTVEQHALDVAHFISRYDKCVHICANESAQARYLAQRARSAYWGSLLESVSFVVMLQWEDSIHIHKMHLNGHIFVAHRQQPLRQTAKTPTLHFCLD